jgi:hypothetical protein
MKMLVHHAPEQSLMVLAHPFYTERRGASPEPPLGTPD